MPAHKIKIYNESTNKFETKSLQTLTFFKNSSIENSVQVTATKSSNASTCLKEVSKNETRTLLRKHESNMNESLPNFSIIESSINENKALNVPLPLIDAHNNSLIDTADCNLFQKGELTLTSTPAPKTQKLHCKNPIISIKPITENHETYSNTTKDLIKIFGEQEYILEYDKRRKMLKSKKDNENLARYRDIIAQIQVKIVCEDDHLKKELKNLSNNIRHAGTMGTLISCLLIVVQILYKTYFQ